MYVEHKALAFTIFFFFLLLLDFSYERTKEVTSWKAAVFSAPGYIELILHRVVTLSPKTDLQPERLVKEWDTRGQ